MTKRRRGIFGFSLEGDVLRGVGAGSKGGILTRRRRHSFGHPKRFAGLLLPSGAVIGGGTRRRRRKVRRHR